MPFCIQRRPTIGYEDSESLEAKMDLIIEEEYGGAMIYGIDEDDHNGVCGKKNKLLNLVSNKLLLLYRKNVLVYVIAGFVGGLLIVIILFVVIIIICKRKRKFEDTEDLLPGDPPAEPNGKNPFRIL